MKCIHPEIEVSEYRQIVCKTCGCDFAEVYKQLRKEVDRIRGKE
jgi:hypothetical protein